MNLDNHIEGDFNLDNPLNQKDQADEFLCITELLGACEYDLAFDKIVELRIQLVRLRELAKQTEQTYYFNRLNKLIQTI